MLSRFAPLLLLILWCGYIECFCDRNLQFGLKCGKSLISTAGSLSPLRPVGGEKTIPRLEPGLRFVQARARFLTNINKNIKVSNFDLGFLSKYDPQGMESPRHHLSDVLNTASTVVNRWTGSLSKYAQKGINAALVLSTLGVMPRKALARGTSVASTAAIMTATVLAASQFATANILSFKSPPTRVSTTSIGKSSLLEKANNSFQKVKSMLDVDLNFMKWKNYDRLSPTQRLATTPVYFLANARGNSYMQNDAKVYRYI